MLPVAFTDLPDDWPTRPLTEPQLVADVLDLLVSEADRAAGAILIALCDGERRLLQPMIIGELPARAASGDCADMVEPLLGELAAQGLAAAVLVALARPGDPTIGPGDQRWRAAVERACADGFELIGVHVVTAKGSRGVTC